MNKYKSFILNAADFVRKHNIRIEWSRAFSQALVDLMLLVFYSMLESKMTTFSPYFEALKTLNVDFGAMGHFYLDDRSAQCDLWGILTLLDGGDAQGEFLGALMRYHPEGANVPHSFPRHLTYVRDAEEDRDSIKHHPLLCPVIYGIKSSKSTFVNWFLLLANSPAIHLTTALCDAVFDASAKIQKSHNKSSGMCEAIAGHPVFQQQPRYVDWVFGFELFTVFPLYVLSNPNLFARVNLENNQHLKYVFAFSLGCVMPDDALVARWAFLEYTPYVEKMSKTRVQDFIRLMIEAEYSNQVTALQPNFAEWVGPKIDNKNAGYYRENAFLPGGEERYAPYQSFCYKMRRLFAFKFKKEPDRHVLKEVYLKFLSENLQVKTALLEAFIVERPCLFLNVLMSHRSGPGLKRTKDYEVARSLVRGAAVSEALINRLKQTLAEQVPSPREAVLYLGLSNHLISDAEMKQIMLTHLLPGAVPLERDNPVRDALKLLSDIKYQWLLKQIGRLTASLVEVGQINPLQLSVADKKTVSPLALILNSGKRSRDYKDTEQYKNIIGLKVLSVSDNPSVFFPKQQSEGIELQDNKKGYLRYSNGSG